MKFVDPDGREVLNIQQQLLPVNIDGNRPGTSLYEAKSVVMHWTGVPGQTAQQTRDYFGLSTTETSAHYVVGQEGEIIQMIPDNEKAYHAGGTGSLTDFAKKEYTTPNGTVAPNLYTIGVEVNPEKKDGSYSKKAFNSSAKLAAKILNDKGLKTPFRGNLVRHGDITGKDCPKAFMNSKTKWELFKLKVMIEQIKQKISMENVNE